MALLAWDGLYAQDFIRDYERMMESYRNTEEYSLAASMHTYSDWASDKPVETMKAEMRRHGSNYLCRMDGTIMLVNKRCRLMVQPSRKMMIYSSQEKKKKGKPMELELDEGLLPDMSGVLDMVRERAEYMGEKDGIRHYSIVDGGGHLERMEMYIDTESYMVSRIEYYYDKKAYAGSSKSVLVYDRIDTSPDFSDSDFSESPYVEMRGGVPVPIGRYSDYELISN